MCVRCKRQTELFNICSTILQLLFELERSRTISFSQKIINVPKCFYNLHWDVCFYSAWSPWLIACVDFMPYKTWKEYSVYPTKIRLNMHSLVCFSWQTIGNLCGKTITQVHNWSRFCINRNLDRNSVEYAKSAFPGKLSTHTVLKKGLSYHLENLGN